MTFVVAFLCAFLVFLCGLLILAVISKRRDKVAARMHNYIAYGHIGMSAGVPMQAQKTLSERFWLWVKKSAESFQTLRRAQRLDVLLQRAGIPLLGSEYLVVMLVAAMALGVLGFMITLQPLALLGGALLGILLSWLYLQIMIGRRKKAFTNQLGDTLAMVANSMRSGFSFMQSMELVSREMAAPMGEEFHQVMTEIHVGATAEQALLAMARRADSRDFDLVVAAVLIQRQVGGNLAQILDSISDTISGRIRMKREVKTLTAQGRLSGWVLAVLPFAVGGLISMSTPQYLQPLFTEDLGRMAIVAGIVWEIIGILVIQRIVHIDV